MGIKAVLPDRLKDSNTVGHVPREISRFCNYLVNYGGTLEGRVRNELSSITDPYAWA